MPQVSAPSPGAAIRKSRSLNCRGIRSVASTQGRNCARRQRSCHTRRSAAEARSREPSAAAVRSATIAPCRVRPASAQAPPMPNLFDMQLRAARRDRAARTGPALFLLESAFEDCLERIALHDRRFERALLIGCPDPSWPKRLRPVSDAIDVRDPGALFAAGAHGETICRGRVDAAESSVRPGDCDRDTRQRQRPAARTAPDPARDARRRAVHRRLVRRRNRLPSYAPQCAPRTPAAGAAAPHVHPRIEPAALAPLLSRGGLRQPVVDIDRVPVSYPTLDRLVADLRAMAGTNILPAATLSWASCSRSRRPAFAQAGDGGRTVETFEVLHFAAWVPAEG